MPPLKHFVEERGSNEERFREAEPERPEEEEEPEPAEREADAEEEDLPLPGWAQAIFTRERDDQTTASSFTWSETFSTSSWLNRS